MCLSGSCLLLQLPLTPQVLDDVPSGHALLLADRRFGLTLTSAEPGLRTTLCPDLSDPADGAAEDATRPGSEGGLSCSALQPLPGRPGWRFPRSLQRLLDSLATKGDGDLLSPGRDGTQ